MSRLYAWLPQAGRLEVAVPDDTTAEAYRDVLTSFVDHLGHPIGRWVDLSDGSKLNLAQTIRLEIVPE